MTEVRRPIPGARDMTGDAVPTDHEATTPAKPEGFAPAELLGGVGEPTPHGEPLPDHHERLPPTDHEDQP